jgi:hypothetical protein
VRRPDEDLFQSHCAHFVALDPVLQEFCRGRELKLEPNALRAPCRMIRKKGNPEYFLDIYQNGVWHKLQYTPDLPHSVMAVGAYWPHSGGVVHRVELMLASEIRFNQIQNRLASYLKAWEDFVALYTIDAI